MGFDLLTSVPHRYTLTRHREQPDAPVWLLRSLPSRVMLAITTIADKEPAIGTTALVEVGLVGFEGVCRDGELMTFTSAGKRLVRGIEVSGGATPELIDLIPVNVLMELGSELMRINTLDVESAKN